MDNVFTNSPRLCTFIYIVINMLNYTAFLWVYKYSMTNSKLKNKTVCSRLNCHRKHNIQVFFQVTKWEQQNNTSISGGRKSFSTEYTIL